MPKKQKLPEKCEAGGICKWPSAGTVAGGLAEMRVSQWFRGVRPHSFVYHIADSTTGANEFFFAAAFLRSDRQYDTILQTAEKAGEHAGRG